MNQKVLSPFRYYGGKAKMAHMISEMIDYENTDIYMEVFGGAGRVLLNKKRHAREIYSDASSGLCAFMKTMSDRIKSRELIQLIYETQYSSEEFFNAFEIRNYVEYSYPIALKMNVNAYLKQLGNRHKNIEALRKSIQNNKFYEVDRLYEAIKKDNILDETELEHLDRYYKKEFEVLKKMFMNFISDIVRKDNIQNIDNISSVLENLANPYYNWDSKKERREREIAYGELVKLFFDDIQYYPDEISDVDLALSTYVVYAQSRDGMGKTWRGDKRVYASEYYRQMRSLNDVAERLQNVEVYNIMADMFIPHEFNYSKGKNDNLFSQIINAYINNERVQMYLDPSYLSVKGEDTSRNDRDLGKGTYIASFGYAEHELLLQSIQKAKCKIIISNYDVDLYNQYLNKSNGWKKIYFETTTGVGGNKVNNKRLEVLWYNY